MAVAMAVVVTMMIVGVMIVAAAAVVAVLVGMGVGLFPRAIHMDDGVRLELGGFRQHRFRDGREVRVRRLRRTGLRD